MNAPRWQGLSVLLTLAITVAVAAVQAAPAPRPATDPKAPDLGEPVEPVLDMTKVVTNPILSLREAANRSQSSNNLKQIALAVLNFESAYNHLPGNITDKDGKPLLSWRVAVLPFIEQEPLHNQFKRDEPWDSEHNLKLLQQFPKVYESPRVKVKKHGYTVYQGFAGPGTVFDPDRKEPLKISNITDGTSNTIFAVEASTAVPWTKPADLPFDPKKDLPHFTKAYGNHALAVTCDGAAHVLNIERIKPETLRSAITINGGEVMPRNWDR